MIKQVVVSLFLLVISFLAFADYENGELVQRDTPQCDSVSVISSEKLMYYFNKNDFDSVELVLNSWETVCGKTEPIVRLRILLAIYGGYFSEEIYDSTVVDYVINYMNRMEVTSVENTFNDYPGYFGYIPIRGDFDYFTQSLADTLLTRSFYNPIELFFSELYANVSTNALSPIQSDTIFLGTEFRDYYFERVNKYRYKPDFHYSISSGIWIPFDNATLLGNHPTIGFQAGIRVKKMTYNVALSFKFGKSKNDYEIMIDGNTQITNEFFGGYIAADIEREIFRFRKYEFDLLGGVGYDSFDAVTVNTEDADPDNDVSHVIGSVNMNFGLGFRYYLKYNRYIGLQGKYNFVNYNNPGGTNLAGNTVNITVIFGRFFNSRKDYYLNQLRYEE